MAAKIRPVTNAASLSNKDVIISMTIIGVLFFLFGFATWINSILIPYFKIACELSNVQSYLVAFAFYISYFVMSVPSSYLLKSIGFKKGMMVGLWIMAVGAILFIPAALNRAYGMFLIGLFTIGTGLAILQSAANPYVTVLGAKEKAAKRISIMGICNKGAGIIAPLLFASMVLKVTDSELFRQLPSMAAVEKSNALDELIRRVIVPYAFMSGLLICLGIFIRFSPLPEIDTEQETAETAKSNTSKTSILHFPHLILGAVAIFLHVGTQVIAIDTIIGYANSMGIQLMEAKVFPSYTLFATIAGYFLGIVLTPKFISQVNVLRLCTCLGIVLTVLIVFAHGKVILLGHTTDISIWFVVMLGFANSMVWAGIWPLALADLGKFTKLGGSVLIMGLSGSAIIPLGYGYLADHYNVREAYWILAPCYIYLVFYAFRGHQFRQWKVRASRHSRPIDEVKKNRSGNLKSVKYLIGLLCLLITLSGSVFAQQFGDGNIVVSHVGTAGGSMTSGPNEVYLDEYTPRGIFVRSIALPRRTPSGFRIVGYFNGNIVADSGKIRFTQLTHLNIAFINPDSTGSFSSITGLSSLVTRAHTYGVKVLAALGGGSAPSYYTTLISPAKRAAFISNIKTLLSAYNLDGIDIDLENSLVTGDYEGFVSDLATAIKPSKILSGAVATVNGSSFTATALSKFDYITLMSYDKTGPWNPSNPGQHSPYSMTFSDIMYWNVTKGVSKDKINAGVPCYGYGFNGSAVTSLKYRQIVNIYPGSENTDQVNMTGGGIMYYNGIPTIKAKATLAIKLAGGISIWSLTQDTTGSKSLLSAIHTVVDSTANNKD